MTISDLVHSEAFKNTRLFTVRDPDTGKEIIACRDSFLLPEHLTKYGHYEVVRESISQEEANQVVANK